MRVMRSKMDHACYRNLITPSLVMEDANIGTGLIPYASSVPSTGSSIQIINAFPFKTSVGRRTIMMFALVATRDMTF